MNFKSRLPSNRKGQLISKAISLRWGKAPSLSNKSPWLLIFSVLPDPVRLTMPTFRSLYFRSRYMGYLRCCRCSGGGLAGDSMTIGQVSIIPFADDVEYHR